LLAGPRGGGLGGTERFPLALSRGFPAGHWKQKGVA
jgi:hypothetical protein